MYHDLRWISGGYIMRKYLSRLIRFLIVTVILFSGAALISADEAARITVDEVEGVPGQSVTINIGLDGLPENNVSAAQFEVSYDADVLELVSVDEFGGILNGGGQGNNEQNSNPYIISYGDGISVINTATEGKIATFIFDVKESSEVKEQTEVVVSCDQIIDASDSAGEIQLVSDTETGTVTIKNEIAHEHEYGEWEIEKEASCEESGVRSHTCNICGFKESEVIEKTEHETSEWIIKQEASCAETGLKEKNCVNCGKLLAEEIIQPTGHVLEVTTTDEPTCTLEGYSQTICSVCKEVLSVDTLPSKGHCAGEWVVEKVADCTHDGLRAKYCTVCNELLETEVTDAMLGHLEGEWKVETEPTCDTEGERTLRCSRCNEEIDIQYTNPLGHSYGEWSVLREPSAEAEGLEERTCSICNGTDKRVIPKVGHEECEHLFDGLVEYTVEPFCTETGIKRIHCSIEGCNDYIEEVVPATGHKEGEWITDTEPSCLEEGEESLYCVNCGEKLETRKNSALGHEYGEWITSKESSCIEAGEINSICSRCGQVVSEIVAPKGHSFSEWTVSKEATCSEEGKKERKCDVCLVSESEIIPAAGHQEGDWIIEVEASCSKDGKRTKKCQVCDEIIATEIIGKKPHKVDTWNDVQEATCQAEGSQSGVCPECGETITQLLPKTSHIAEDEPVLITEPTCELEGKKESHCKYCDKTMETQVIQALGHNYGDPVVVTEPTCTKAGKQIQTCDRCGQERYTDISPIGHSYGEPVVKQAATYNRVGSAIRTCEACGDELTIVIPKIDVPHKHNYNGVKEIIKKATCSGKGEMHVHCSDPLCDSYQTVPIPQLTHQYSGWTVTEKATYSKKGTKQRTCELCGMVEKTSIPTLTRRSISGAKITCPATKVFTGLALTPVPIVKLDKKTLKNGTDFGLSYKNNKNVGVATITITGKGAYKGTIKRTFKILPKNTTISKLSPGSKKIIVEWKKQTVQVTGYQIQYSTNSDFKKSKTVTISNAATFKRTISGLDNKCKYYVRIRTYKTAGSNKYYSSWSPKKSVTTK